MEHPTGLSFWSAVGHCWLDLIPLLSSHLRDSVIRGAPSLVRELRSGCKDKLTMFTEAPVIPGAILPLCIRINVKKWTIFVAAHT